jgi:chromosome segregation ATPase
MSAPTDTPQVLGSPTDSIEAVDVLQAQLAKLRAACAEHTHAEQHLEDRLAAVAARESELAVRVAAAEARERAAAEAQAAAEQREKAANEALSSLKQREAAMRRQEETLAQDREAIRAREEELQSVRARLDGLRQALRSMAIGGADAPPPGKNEDLETLITAAVRRAVDTQREADQMSTRLQAAEFQVVAAEQRVTEAEQRVTAAEQRTREASAKSESLERERDAFARHLYEAQALCAQVQSDAEKMVTELRAEIKRLSGDRDKAQARLDRQTDRIERAGLQIQWDHVKQPRRRKSA